jgi:uncharacterized protein (TIGR01777 family)
MHVLVTGATGFIGRPLVTRLLEQGHRVSAFSRDPGRAHPPLKGVERVHAWNPSAEPAPAEAFAGVEAVIHLAGESVSGRWTDEKKRRIRDSRVVGTRQLVAGMRAARSRPTLLVCASAMGYYGSRGDELLTEDSSPGQDFLAEVCVEWEREGSQARELGVRVAHLRIGLVLGRDGGALEAMLLPFKLGAGGPLGSGNQWWSWIHLQDLVSLFLRATERSWEGPWNAVGPTPVRQGEFAKVLGRVLGRPAFLPAPAFALRIVLGEFADELLSSKRISAQMARDEGFPFAHGDLEAALRDLLA